MVRIATMGRPLLNKFNQGYEWSVSSKAIWKPLKRSYRGCAMSHEIIFENRKVRHIRVDETSERKFKAPPKSSSETLTMRKDFLCTEQR